MPRALSTLLVVLAIAGLVAGCGGGSGGGGSSAGSSASSASGTSSVVTAGTPIPDGCRRFGDPGARQDETHEKRPPSRLQSTSASVVLQTTCGSFTITLAVRQAPKTATEPAGTSGSQFFVVTAADAGLPPQYALVGRVTSGRDVVDRIAKMPTADNEQPIVPVVIERATLQGG